jgi:ubiquinone/menaquinone biosynthesis C-methylase UbiE
MADGGPSPARPSRWLVTFLRISFRLLYHELSWTYELVAWTVSLGLWRRWRETAIEFLPPAGRVLEIGAGRGVLALEMARRGGAVIALDRSPQMARAALRRFRAAAARGVPRPPHVVRADVMHPPFQRESFSAVVSTFPAEFILVPQVIQATARLLSPGGRFIIVPSAVFTGNRLPQRWARQLFKVTGQVPAWVAPLAESLTLSGLTVEQREIPVDASIVSVVVGTRR